MAWAVGLVLAVTVANTALFVRALPAARHTTHPHGVPRRHMAAYAAADYIGQLGQVAVSKSLPLLILAHLGAEQTAYYSLAYLITDTLYQAAYSMGQSLTVEGAAEPDKLAEHARHMLRHTTILIAPATAVTVAAAPWILQLFGTDYAEHGTTVMRLMALSALPNILFGTAVHVARVRRSLLLLAGLQLAFAGLLLVLVLVLMPGTGSPASARPGSPPAAPSRSVWPPPSTAGCPQVRRGAEPGQEPTGTTVPQAGTRRRSN
ncbi:MATE family efflux transporter [Kitasatospora sp. NBC_00374]|uniref:MATE family efflux transporter n=1 Tax=Kitasatospora sp. NBC_00374 TaxID=2975964 RepID=UPI00352CB831